MRPRPANSKLGFPHAGLMQAGPAGPASSYVLWKAMKYLAISILFCFFLVQEALGHGKKILVLLIPFFERKRICLLIFFQGPCITQTHGGQGVDAYLL